MQSRFRFERPNTEWIRHTWSLLNHTHHFAHSSTSEIFVFSFIHILFIFWNRKQPFLFVKHSGPSDWKLSFYSQFSYLFISSSLHATFSPLVSLLFREYVKIIWTPNNVEALDSLSQSGGYFFQPYVPFIPFQPS